MELADKAKINVSEVCRKALKAEIARCMFSGNLDYSQIIRMGVINHPMDSRPKVGKS